MNTDEMKGRARRCSRDVVVKWRVLVGELRRARRDAPYLRLDKSIAPANSLLVSIRVHQCSSATPSPPIIAALMYSARHDDPAPAPRRYRPHQQSFSARHKNLDWQATESRPRARAVQNS